MPNPTPTPEEEKIVLPSSRSKSGRQLIEEHDARVEAGTVRTPPRYTPITFPTDRGKKIGGPGGHGHQ